MRYLENEVQEIYCSNCPIQEYRIAKTLFDHSHPGTLLRQRMVEKLEYLAGTKGIIYPDIPEKCNFPCDMKKEDALPV